MCIKCGRTPSEVKETAYQVRVDELTSSGASVFFVEGWGISRPFKALVPYDIAYYLNGVVYLEDIKAVCRWSVTAPTYGWDRIHVTFPIEAGASIADVRATVKSLAQQWRVSLVRDDGTTYKIFEADEYFNGVNKLTFELWTQSILA